MDEKKYYKGYIFLASAVAYGIALFHLDPGIMDMIMDYFKYIGLFFIGFIFPLGLLITIVKGRRCQQ